MEKSIHVMILDDHQSIVDGYLYRLGMIPEVEVVATLTYGEELELMLDLHSTDVLLLDVNVPTSPTNPNPYPILHAISSMLQRHPGLNILVISMFAERGLIRSVMESGASGYILKDDQSSIRDLGNIIRSVGNGGIYFSQKAHQLYVEYLSKNGADELLTARQREVLSLSAAYPDSTTADLAQKMSISNSTVRNLLSGAYVRLEVHNRAAAIAKARQLGVITPDSTTTPLPKNPTGSPP